MLDKLKNIMSSNMEDIYLTGIWDSEDREFISNSDYLYLEFSNLFLKLEAVDGYGKLKITIDNEINNFNDGMEGGKMKISQFIFLNPLSDNIINSVTFFNLNEDVDYITTDVLLIEFKNNQKIFIDPSFIGINIGGVEQMEFWEDNLLNFIHGIYPQKTQLFFEEFD